MRYEGALALLLSYPERYIKVKDSIKHEIWLQL